MRRNRRIRQSLYLDLASELRENIVSKKCKPGDLLPTETQLCRDFRVRPGTVVKAAEATLG